MLLAPICTTRELRAIEDEAIGRGEPLMERAGLAAADHACALCAESGGVLVLAGPGNNGGDAFEMAAHLKRRFFRVDVLFAGDAGRLSRDAAAAFGKWREAGGREITAFPSRPGRRYGLLVDGLFGIGLARPLEGRHAELIRQINESGAPVLALDVPSGLNADTGAVMGCAVRAAHTITFIALKPGLLTLDGSDCSGTLAVDALRLDAAQASSGRLLSEAIVRQALSPRAHNFHKGNAGNVAVLGGAAGMMGAALLAGRAALACGAGRVYLGLLDPHASGVDTVQPELMLRGAQDAPLEEAVVAAGPGMGRSDEARALLERVLRADSPLVLDADALNLIASAESLQKLARERSAATLMTPHPAEAGRLLGMSTSAVQRDRLASAHALADRFRAWVALKGNGTIIAGPDARWWINPTGHPGMASAGMGDALTGIAAALMAQGTDPATALCCGVWLHGAAGDAAALKNEGQIGTTASDVIRETRALLNRHLASR